MKKTPRPSKASNDPTETLSVLGPVARSSVVDAVADRLRREILAGRLAAGSRLPSERELSLALGVNRLTLRAALARLEALGLVTTRHGSGTEISPWRERAGLEALGMVMNSLDSGEPAWLELLTSLLEIRRILAGEAVALACDRHTDEDLSTMQRIADEQAARVHDPISYARGDMAFQRAMARAAGNVGIELILNSIARFPEEHPELVASLYDRCEEAVHFYGAVMDLVRARNGDAARTAVKMALGAVDDAWLQRHGYDGTHETAGPSLANAPYAHESPREGHDTAARRSAKRAKKAKEK